MRTYTIIRVGLATLTVCMLVACAATPTAKPTDEGTVQLGEAVEIGEPTPVAAEAATEKVCNCGILDDTMTKQVELSYSAAHAIMWEFGGEVGFDVSVEPLGVGGDIGFAISGAYGEEWASSRTRTVGFPLTAEPDTNMEYTIEWREYWQGGYIPVRTPTGQEQVEYHYLIHIDGDIIERRDLGCAYGCEGDVTPTLPLPAVDLPEGYELYDDFTTPGTLDNNWWLNDANKICSMSVSGGALSFDCHNETTEDLLATLHPSDVSFGEPTGVAASVYVEKAGDAPHLITNWVCQESGEERAYHLALDTERVSAVEYHPQENWRQVNLGKASVAPDQAHLLQIEQSPGGVTFYVDGRLVPLDTAPEWLDCLSMRDWALDFLVWPDHSTEGQVKFVGFTVFDVLSHFDGESLDSSKWCRTEGTVEPLIEGGSLSLNATSPGGHTGGSVWACRDETPFQVVETEVTVLEGSDMSHTGLMARLGYDGTQEWYFSFGLLGNGDIYLYRAPVGESPEGYEGTWPGSGLGISHRLRLEWTGTEARFIADGEQLTSLPSSELGEWVALMAEANNGGKTINALDWAGWTFR